ncbi:MAG: hypothetical protein KatS3mg105_3323 [Gemmatales bacterium]|nr:MAG: hypothetical protein KatS3mg105_3323 [Gemmatales bacterium]
MAERIRVRTTGQRANAVLARHIDRVKELIAGGWRYTKRAFRLVSRNPFCYETELVRDSTEKKP